MKTKTIDERAEAISSGKFVRVAALGHNALGIYRVKVIFRGPNNVEMAYWMNQETYRALPLGQVFIVEDYQVIGKVDEARNANIYDAEVNPGKEGK